MKDNPIEFLNRIKTTILGKTPDAQIFVFGYRARGTANKDSDWDILILLPNERINSKDESILTDPLYDLELETGEVISPFIYSETEWNNRYAITPLYKQIQLEARRL
jgi:predicted nucleotidyltransferase